MENSQEKTELQNKIRIITLGSEEPLKIRVGGNKYAFTIPKALVDNKVLDGDKDYEIVVYEVKRDQGRKLNKPTDKTRSNGPIAQPGYNTALEMGVFELPSSKEDYLSGKVAIPVSEESWAEQWMLGYPNKNLNPNVKIQ